MGRDFPPVQTGPEAQPASCTMGTGTFLGVKYGRGVLLTTHPLLVPWCWKSRAIPLPTLWATTRPVTGTLYLFTINYILHAIKCLTYKEIFKVNIVYVKEMCVLHHANFSEKIGSIKTAMEVWCWTTNSPSSLDLHIKWE